MVVQHSLHSCEVIHAVGLPMVPHPSVPSNQRTDARCARAHPLHTSVYTSICGGSNLSSALRTHVPFQSNSPPDVLGAQPLLPPSCERSPIGFFAWSPLSGDRPPQPLVLPSFTGTRIHVHPILLSMLKLLLLLLSLLLQVQQSSSYRSNFEPAAIQQPSNAWFSSWCFK